MKTLVILAPPAVTNGGSGDWTASMAPVFKNQPVMRLACDLELRYLNEQLFGRVPASDLRSEGDLGQVVQEFVMGFAGGNGVLFITRRAFPVCLAKALSHNESGSALSIPANSFPDTEPACVAIQLGNKDIPERIARISSTLTLVQFAIGVMYEQATFNFRGDGE